MSLVPIPNHNTSICISVIKTNFQVSNDVDLSKNVDIECLVVAIDRSIDKLGKHQLQIELLYIYLLADRVARVAKVRFGLNKRH